MGKHLMSRILTTRSVSRNISKFSFLRATSNLTSHYTRPHLKITNTKYTNKPSQVRHISTHHQPPNMSKSRNPVFASGNTAVITGGASGIGLALATKCAGYGMNVVIADNNSENLKGAKEMISKSGCWKGRRFREFEGKNNQRFRREDLASGPECRYRS